MSYARDKAMMEKHAKILREMVKRPENKVCADCKRNDPRWASWNIGVFLCIRCSGIHRSMGTHISKIKSIDLDKWTPEQMASIQKWGNHLANLYWEAHLKAGHVPPDHKMESFIRSKYETRRWAKEGPPPSDPSTLDSGASSSSTAPTVHASPPSQSYTQAPSPPPRQSQNLFDLVDSESNNTAPSRMTTQQPKPHHLLSASYKQQQHKRQPQQQQAAAPSKPQVQPQPAAPQNDLFSLDFHAPSPPATSGASTASSPTQTKDVKNDIMSLFSSAPAAQPQPSQAGVGGMNAFGSFGTGSPQQAQWGWGGQQPLQQQQQPQQAAQFGGMTGAAPNMWGGAGVDGGFGAPPPAQSNVWASTAVPAAPQNNSSLFGGDTNAVWAGNTSPATNIMAGGGDPFGSFAGGGSASTTTTAAQKKNDAFGDLWGSFK